MKKIIALSLTVIVIAASVWFVLSYFSGDHKQAPVAPQTTTQKMLTVDPTDPFKGDRTAPVTIITVGSYSCPACKDSATIMDQLLARYPDKVRIVWKDLPEESSISYDAALAARCAQQQGKFWQYHDILFAKQDILAAENLYSSWAGDAGIRTQEFDACIQKRETQGLVDDNITEGLNAGITAVPYFQINGQAIQGMPAQGLFYFQTVIDDVLKNVSAK